MVAFRKALPGEMEDIIDFADFVFSKAHGPHDFARLVPKLYGADKNTSHMHYVAVEQGKLKALVCCMITPVTVGGVPLTIGHIGSVCTHPAEQGKGYMKRLMAMVEDELQHQGVHLSLLDGNRRRYRHFGYEKTGIRHQFTMPARFQDQYTGQIELVPLQSAEDIQAAYGIYRNNPVICRSQEDFREVLTTWQCQPHLVLHQGSPAGYLTGTDREIREMLMINPALLPSAIVLWCKQRGQSTCSLSLPPYEPALLQSAFSAAADYRATWHNNYKIYDFAKVITAFGNLRPGLTNLTDDSWVIGIGQQVLELVLSGGVLSATPTAKVPKWQWPDAMAASQALFSPMPSMQLPPIFPLPLHQSDLDCC